MRTGFRPHGVRSALQRESSSSGQPRFARSASLIENQRSRSLPRVLARCAKISATSANMRTGFRPHGVRSALQSESSSSRQPHIAMGASLIENQSPRGLPLGLSGAATRIRTGDLILTKDVLYQLSHSSIFVPFHSDAVYYIKKKAVCQYVFPKTFVKIKKIIKFSLKCIDKP